MIMTGHRTRTSATSAGGGTTQAIYTTRDEMGNKKAYLLTYS
jgi:hypothetical protein